MRPPEIVLVLLYDGDINIDLRTDDRRLLASGQDGLVVEVIPQDRPVVPFPTSVRA